MRKYFFWQGDTNIFTYEIISEPPHLFELSHIKVPEAHQASALNVVTSRKYCAPSFEASTTL